MHNGSDAKTNLQGERATGLPVVWADQQLLEFITREGLGSMVVRAKPVAGTDVPLCVSAGPEAGELARMTNLRDMWHEKATDLEAVNKRLQDQLAERDASLSQWSNRAADLSQHSRLLEHHFVHRGELLAQWSAFSLEHLLPSLESMETGGEEVLQGLKNLLELHQKSKTTEAAKPVKLMENTEKA